MSHTVWVISINQRQILSGNWKRLASRLLCLPDTIMRSSVATNRIYWKQGNGLLSNLLRTWLCLWMCQVQHENNWRKSIMWFESRDILQQITVTSGRDACTESDVAYAMFRLRDVQQNIPRRNISLAEWKAVLCRRYEASSKESYSDTHSYTPSYSPVIVTGLY